MKLHQPKHLIAVWLLSCFVLLAPLASYAQVTLTDGTEIIVTDENSEVILGYGTVTTGQFDLNLNMDEDNLGDSMVVLFISPDGSFVTLRGYIGADNNFWLTDEDNSQLTNLASLSRDANLNLAISGTAATTFATSDAPDDNLLRDPDQVAQPALGITPATTTRQNSFVFGESDDDDRDRRVTNTATDPADERDNGDEVAAPPSPSPAEPTSPETPREDVPDGFGEPPEDGDSGGGGSDGDGGGSSGGGGGGSSGGGGGNDGSGGGRPDVVDGSDEPDPPEGDTDTPEPAPDDSDSDSSDGDSSSGDSSEDDSTGTEDNDSDDSDSPSEDNDENRDPDDADDTQDSAQDGASQ
ncbi:MAG: hypothetical protein AAF708_17200 [Deinococcota bacterium]